MSRPVVVYSPRYACDIGRHVFPVAKYALILEQLLANGNIEERDVIEPPAPNPEELRLVHTSAYMDDLDGLNWTERTMASELPLTREIVDAYELAASGTTLAARRALAGETAVHIGGGFHHAFAEHAEGFCYVNDLAVAIRALQRDGSIQRAAVVDLDVHQGNGTAHIFGDDPTVFTLSVHQQDNYPAFKERSTIDIGLSDGADDDAYAALLEPALDRVWSFGPDLVLYQAGADPYAQDQLGGLGLTMAGLEKRDRLVLEGAARHGIPAVVTLGGGYAHRVEDTVAIHATTCRIALRARAQAAKN